MTLDGPAIRTTRFARIHSQKNLGVPKPGLFQTTSHQRRGLIGASALCQEWPLKPAKARPSSAKAKRAKGGGDDCEEAGRRDEVG